MLVRFGKHIKKEKIKGNRLSLRLSVLIVVLVIRAELNISSIMPAISVNF